MLSTAACFDFRKAMDAQQVILVNLPKGLLGETCSSTLAAFIVARIQQVALSRADSYSRKPFYLYLDEFQNYTTNNILDILSESRKYNLSLILAHQYLDQLPLKTKSAVLNISGNVVCFRVGHEDAVKMAKILFKNHQDQGDPKLGLRFKNVYGLPYPALSLRSHGRDRYEDVQSITGLQNREFWYIHRSAIRAMKMRSLEMPNPRVDRVSLCKVSSLRNLSGNCYAESKEKPVSYTHLRAHET